MPKIIVKKDAAIVEIFNLKQELILVGSDPGADVCIRDLAIARKQGEIFKKGRRFYVRDLGTVQRMLLNELRLDDEKMLGDGDELKVGAYTVVFNHLPEEAQALEETEPEVAPAPQPAVPTAVEKPVPVAPVVSPPPVQHPGVVPPDSAASAKTVLAEVFTDESERKTRVLDVEKSMAPQYAKPIPPVAPLPEPVSIRNVLVGVQGPLAGKKFTLNKPETRIGREKNENEIVIEKDSFGEPDRSISRRHLSIFFQNNQYYLKDVGSKTGVLLNGKIIAKGTLIPIDPGDEITIQSERSPSVFRLCHEGQEDFSAPKKQKVLTRLSPLILALSGTSVIVLIIILILLLK